MLKPLAVWITTGQEATEPDMEKWTGSKLEKEYVKAVYYHSAYLCTYAEYIMRNARLDEAQAGIKIAGEISMTSDRQMMPTLWQKAKRN